MRRRVIAFDLDGTLAPSKSPLPDRMAAALSKLLDSYQVCVISGGKFEQFEKQLLGNLKAEPAKLTRMHIMPTCGTRYYKYQNDKWQQIYAEDFEEPEKKEIIEALKKGVDNFNYHEKKAYGPTIEDRGSQISWSALGQNIVDELGEEGIRLKEEWDPGNKKKLNLVNFIAPLIPEFEVRAGGATTIDITKKGIDKAYGMQKLMNELKISKDQILFIGDKMMEGGNDYPVKAFGIDCMEISHWQDAALVVEAITEVT